MWELTHDTKELSPPPPKRERMLKVEIPSQREGLQRVIQEEEDNHQGSVNMELRGSYACGILLVGYTSLYYKDYPIIREISK